MNVSSPASFTVPPAWTQALPPLFLRGRRLLPIVQGGMGVGISAHRLAGSVAGLGAVGTIASVDLRRKHPDLMEVSARGDKATVDAANLDALDREIRAAKALAAGRGVIAVNVMRAVSEYAAYVRQACASGADAIVVGAGLPLDLPELAAQFPDVALIPILSDARGIALVVKKWARKGRLPDAIVIEHPRYAGGHLGAAKIEDLDDPRFDFERVLPGGARFLQGRGNRGGRDSADSGGRHQHARADPRIARAGRRRRADRHGVRGDRGRRRRHRVQARAGRTRGPRTSSSS